MKRSPTVDARFRMPDAMWDRVEFLLPKYRRSKKGGRPRKGVASNFLTETLRSRQKAGVFVHTSPGFRLPAIALRMPPTLRNGQIIIIGARGLNVKKIRSFACPNPLGVNLFPVSIVHNQLGLVD